MKARDEVLRFLGDRAPSYVPLSIMRNRLRNVEPNELTKALDELVSESLVQQPPPGVAQPNESFYRLTNTSNLPIRRSITIAGVVLPRVTSDSPAYLFPELYNESLEVLSEYTLLLEHRFKEIVAEQERRYWGQVSGVFAILVSVLAFLLVGLPKITTDPSLFFWQVVLLNTAQILPLAVTLVLFVALIKWIVR